MEQSKGLDGGTLKLMAAALMLIDHVGAILLPETVILRCIGRLAFPIFAFFIAEGYAHTRSFGRYLLRMAIWAAVSEIPFNLEFGHFFVPGRQNVLWTFCLALLTLRGLDRLRRVPGVIGYAGAALALATGFAAGKLLHVDYGGWGVMTVALFYLCREGRYARCGLLLGMLVLNGLCISSRTVPAFGIAVPIQILAAAALPVIWLYNGRPGVNRRWRWAFYAFYPAHLLVLEGIQALT